MSGSSPIVIVAGLGRCGSSLMMQMLSAAGLRCAGEYPAFEPNEADRDRISGRWLSRFEAVKILDPQRRRLPSGLNAIVLWLDRDVFQQAASQVKFLHTVLELAIPDVAAGRFATALIRDREKALASLRRFPILGLNFEHTIQRPVEASATIAAWLESHGRPVSITAMASCVLERSSDCRPDMSIETDLLELALGQRA